ncbi:MAG: right-handed parallel beta-helix repeat-containing protein, partial [Chloroflexus sp.]
MMKKTASGRLLMMLGWLVTFIAAAYPLTPAHGATGYYVSPTGNDANPGTLTQPFRTIQKCAEVATAGDTCYIRAGVYRETVRPANSGASGAPITFKPYNNEQVVISGADLLTGPWTLHSGAIYRTTMPWDASTRTISAAADNQIWVNGVMLPEARWPNIPVARVTRLTNQDKAQADSATISDESAATYHDSDLSVFSNNFWAGGQITFGPGYSSIHTTCDVTASTRTSVSFQCNPDPAANNNRSK